MKNLNSTKNKIDTALDAISKKERAIKILGEVEREINSDPHRYPIYHNVTMNTQDEKEKRGDVCDGDLSQKLNFFLKDHWKEFADFTIAWHEQNVAKLSKEAKKAMLNSLGVTDEDPE